MCAEGLPEDHFDYQSVSEEPEQLDFDKLISCPHCHKPIPHDATLCYYCGKETSSPGGAGWMTWVVIVLIIIVAALLVRR